MKYVLILIAGLFLVACESKAPDAGFSQDVLDQTRGNNNVAND